jgi:prepilin-type N-terminal cleavage/methylation domain-containing protein
MKNKYGFTLVELLAVIAILAILVIIALPNVMGMFNDAKMRSFETEAGEILKVAEQRWIADTMLEAEEKVYVKCDNCDGNELDLSGRKNIDYYIKVNKGGKVVEYYITDGTYQYEY